MNKEQVYDNEISPLMAEILEICKREKIAMVASFSIPTPDDDGLMCTSCLLDDDFYPPSGYLEAKDAIMGGGSFSAAIMITSRFPG